MKAFKDVAVDRFNIERWVGLGWMELLGLFVFSRL
jgi:hypothetical protein